MAAYEAPISSVNWYQHYASEPPTGYAHELGSVATTKSQRSAMSGSVPDVEKVKEKVGTAVSEGEGDDRYKGGKKGGGARMLSERLGRLRPEQVSYEARVDTKEREREGERSSREEGETRSIESINSRRMIIKRGWSGVWIMIGGRGRRMRSENVCLSVCTIERGFGSFSLGFIGSVIYLDGFVWVLGLVI